MNRKTDNNNYYKSNIPKAAQERKVSDYKEEKGCIRYQENECLYHGKVVGRKYYYKNGTLIMEIPLKNGKKHGLQYEWYDNGNIELIEPYFEGKIHGEARQFDENGKFLGVYSLKHGSGFDIWRQKDENGNIYISEIHTLENNFPHGFEWWVNPDQRTVRHERHWRHGKYHGIERMWDFKGRMLKGYPKYYVNNREITKRTYLSRTTKDTTLPKFHNKYQFAERIFPLKIRKLIAK